MHVLDRLIGNVKSRIYSLPIHEHVHQLYHRESFDIWSTIGLTANA